MLGLWIEWSDKRGFFNALRENQKLARKRKNVDEDEKEARVDSNSSDSTSIGATSVPMSPEILDPILDEAFRGGDVEPEWEGEETHHPAVFSGYEEWIVSPQGWGGGSGKVYFDYAIACAGFRMGIRKQESRKIPNVKVEIGSIPLAVLGGLDAAWKWVSRAIGGFNGTVKNHVLSRVDIYTDGRRIRLLARRDRRQVSNYLGWRG